LVIGRRPGATLGGDGRGRGGVRGDMIVVIVLLLGPLAELLVG
jgi:hypothetical protein